MPTQKKDHPWKRAVNQHLREKEELAGGFLCPWCKHYATYTAFMKEHWEAELVCTCNECQKNFFIRQGCVWKKYATKRFN